MNSKIPHNLFHFMSLDLNDEDFGLLQNALAEENIPEGARARYWGCTLNNWTDDDVLNLHIMHERGVNGRQGRLPVLWTLFNREIGEHCGTKHLQIVWRFQDLVSWSRVKANLNGRGHFYRIDTRKGGLQRAIDYHSKSETADPAYEPSWTELGERPEHRQGERSDLEYLVAAMLDGGSVDSWVESGDSNAITSFIKYPAGAKLVMQAVQKKRAKERDYRKPEVYWLYGPTASGKSKFARTDDDLYVYGHLAKGTPWFDGYDGETSLLIDEIRIDTFAFNTLLQILDGYTMKLPAKGSMIYTNFSKIYITCPEHWYHIFQGRSGDDHWVQLARRITHTFLVLPKGYDDKWNAIPEDDKENFIPIKEHISWLDYCKRENIKHVLDYVDYQNSL
jgi:hypothetical protein